MLCVKVRVDPLHEGRLAGARHAYADNRHRRLLLGARAGCGTGGGHGGGVDCFFGGTTRVQEGRNRRLYARSGEGRLRNTEVMSK